MIESERLARRYFSLFGQDTFEKLREIVHPDVVLDLKAVQPGCVVKTPRRSRRRSAQDSSLFTGKADAKHDV